MKILRALFRRLFRRHDWITVGRVGPARIQACTRCYGTRVKGYTGGAR